MADIRLDTDDIAHMQEHIEHYPEARAGAIYCLYHVQNKCGYITQDGIEVVSQLTGLSVTQLDELITFYTLLRRRPIGSNIMRVCDSISCHVRGAKKVLDAAKNESGVELGQISKDGSVTVVPSICLGLCDRAPAALINEEEVIGELTPETVCKRMRQMGANKCRAASHRQSETPVQSSI